MIQGKLIEYGQDLTNVYKVWEDVFSDRKHLYQNNDNEIAIYGVVYNNDGVEPIAAGKLKLSDDNYIIDNIAVISKERNKGYGDFIVKLLINKAFMSGAECVKVISEPSYVKFFEKIGFEIENTDIDQLDGKLMKIITSKICRKCSKI